MFSAFLLEGAADCTVQVWRAAKGEWSTSVEQTNRDEMFRDEDREFLDAVVSGATIHCDVAESSKSVRVVMAAQGDQDALMADLSSR